MCMSWDTLGACSLELSRTRACAHAEKYRIHYVGTEPEKLQAQSHSFGMQGKMMPNVHGEPHSKPPWSGSTCMQTHRPCVQSHIHMYAHTPASEAGPGAPVPLPARAAASPAAFVASAPRAWPAPWPSASPLCVACACSHPPPSRRPPALHTRTRIRQHNLRTMLAPPCQACLVQHAQELGRHAQE